jgi:cytochrome c
MLKIMMEKQRLAHMSIHERVLEQYRCNNCHDTEKDKIAPSFIMIAKRYTKQDTDMLINSIQNGTHGKWQGKKLPMPPFKKMSNKDAKGMVDWILSLKK